MKLVAVLLLLTVADAYRVPPLLGRQATGTTVARASRLMAEAEGPETREGDALPAVEVTEKKRSAGDMPTDFLGVFDTTTPFGALGASVVVSLGFALIIEGVKFIDPNPAARSIFGNIMDGAPPP